MKKYYLVALLIAYNCCAMELDPFDISIDYDDKCYWAARYLHEFPQGKNAQEAKAIERFFEDGVSEQVTVCSWLVNKYKNALATQEAHRHLNSLYTYQEIHRNNPKWNKCTDKEELGYEIRYFSQDLRKKIFAQALWFSAEEYYVAQNRWKCLKIQHPSIETPYSLSNIEYFYKIYFLAEIHKRNVVIHFSNLTLGLPDHAFISSGARLLKDNETENCSTSNRPSITYRCEIKTIKELIAFLDKKDERVHDFTEMFNNYIEQLSCVEKKEGPDAFIFLLTRFKELTQRIVYCYTGRDRLT